MRAIVRGSLSRQHDAMLQLAHEKLPQSLLTYVAFRVALRRTWEAIHIGPRTGGDDAETERNGYLAEVPFLREASLAVQVDVLSRTWQLHMQPEIIQADLLDEAVLYAVCEATAQFVEHEPQQVHRTLMNGPLDLMIPVDLALAADLRQLYLQLPTEGDFLLVGQFLDMPPTDAAEWKQKLGVTETQLQQFFDVLSQWRARPETLAHLRGLITDSERTELAAALQLAKAVKTV